MNIQKKNYHNGSVNYDLIKIENIQIPSEILDKKQEIYDTIHEALLINKGVGIYGADDIVDYKLDLRFIEENK